MFTCSLHSMAVVLVRCVREMHEKTDGVANIQTTDDTAMNQFSKDVSVEETCSIGDCLCLWGLLGRTFEKH